MVALGAVRHRAIPLALEQQGKVILVERGHQQELRQQQTVAAGAVLLLRAQMVPLATRG